MANIKKLTEAVNNYVQAYYLHDMTYRIDECTPGKSRKANDEILWMQKYSHIRVKEEAEALTAVIIGILAEKEQVSMNMLGASYTEKLGNMTFGDVRDYLRSILSSNIFFVPIRQYDDDMNKVRDEGEVLNEFRYQLNQVVNHGTSRAKMYESDRIKDGVLY